MATPTNNSEVKRPRRWWRWLGRGIAASVLLLCIAPAIWLQYAQHELNREIADLRDAGEPMTMEELITFDPPDSQNASLDYLAAGKLINDQSVAWKEWSDSDSFKHEFQLPLTADELTTVQTIVTENESALAKVAAAREKMPGPWGDVFVSPYISNSSNFDYKAPAQVARLLKLAAFAAHANGRDEAAVEHLEDMIRVEEAAMKRPILLAHMVALGIYSNTSDAVSQCARDLRIGANGAQRARVESLLRRLQDEQPLNQGRQLEWQSERIYDLDALQSFMDGKIGGTQISSPDRVQSGSRGLYWIRPFILNDARHLLRHLQGVLKASEAPDWQTAQRLYPTELPRAIESNHLTHLLSSILLPSIKRAMEVDYRAMADRRLADVALAVRLYSIDHHGDLPPTLEALAPAYLTVVPNDPFSGKPLRYIRDGARPIVYSVGPDGIDDGGVEEERRSAKSPRWLKGDIVVNLKTQPRPADQ